MANPFQTPDVKNEVGQDLKVVFGDVESMNSFTLPEFRKEQEYTRAMLAELSKYVHKLFGTPVFYDSSQSFASHDSELQAGKTARFPGAGLPGVQQSVLS